MNKQEFMSGLSSALSGLPQDDIEERLTFYSKMIDDRIEEGLTEEEAVSAAGPIEEIAAQTVSDIPITKLVKERIRPRRKLKAWEIVLLAAGSPMWISLLIAAFAVVLSLYITLWSLIISCWAVFASFAASAAGGIAAGIILACSGHGLTGAAVIGLGIMCAGLSVFSYFGSLAATKGTILLTKKIIIATKNCFIDKEDK